MMSEIDTDNLCKICFFDLSENDYVEFEKCKHVVCLDCFTELAEGHPQVRCPMDVIKSDSITVYRTNSDIIEIVSISDNQRNLVLEPPYKDCVINYFVECKNVFDDTKEIYEKFKTFLDRIDQMMEQANSTTWFSEIDDTIKIINVLKDNFYSRLPDTRTNILPLGNVLERLDKEVPRMATLGRKKYFYLERLQVNKCKLINRKLSILADNLYLSRDKVDKFVQLMISIVKNGHYTETKKYLKEIHALSEMFLASSDESLEYLRAMSLFHNCDIASTIPRLYPNDCKRCLICNHELRNNSLYYFSNCEHGICTKCTEIHLLRDCHCPLHEGGTITSLLGKLEAHAMLMSPFTYNDVLSDYLISITDRYQVLLENLEQLKVSINRFLSFTADKSEGETSESVETTRRSLLICCAKVLLSHNLPNGHLFILINKITFLKERPKKREESDKESTTDFLFQKLFYYSHLFASAFTNSSHENLIEKIIDVVVDRTKMCQEQRGSIQDISVEIDEKFERSLMNLNRLPFTFCDRFMSQLVFLMDTLTRTIIRNDEQDQYN